MKVKGTSFKSALSFVKQKFGEDKLALVLAGLETSDRALLSKTILVSDWYPFRLYGNFLTALDKTLGKGDGKLSRECGRFDAEFDLNTVYKAFYKMTSPQFIIGNAPLVWKAYFNAGRVEIDKHGTQGINFRIRDTDEYAPMVCREMEGWLERTVELSGGRQVVAKEIHCRAQGAAYCEYSIKWQ